MQKSKFRLKQGVGSHRDGSKLYVSGDEIELSENNARGIMDKLDRITPVPQEPAPDVGVTIVEVEPDLYHVSNEKSGRVITDHLLGLEEAKAVAGSDVEVIRLDEQSNKIDVTNLDSTGKHPYLTMVHRGGGKYAITFSESHDQVTSKLFSKNEAREILFKIENSQLTLDDIQTEDEK